MSCKYKLIMACAFVLVSLPSCIMDKEDPTFDIQSPSFITEYQSGTECHFEITFEDNRKLASYKVVIWDDDQNTIPGCDFLFEDNEINGITYYFHEHFIVPDPLITDYYLYVEVVDKQGLFYYETHQLNFVP